MVKHIGQVHAKVEDYLPEEAKIPGRGQKGNLSEGPDLPVVVTGELNLVMPCNKNIKKSKQSKKKLDSVQKEHSDAEVNELLEGGSSCDGKEVEKLFCSWSCVFMLVEICTNHFRFATLGRRQNWRRQKSMLERM